MTISERIRILRKEEGLSQRAFGEKLGVSRDVVNNIENGRVEPAEPIVKLICREFRISYAWLRYGRGTMRTGLEQESVAGAVDELMAGDNETAKAVLRALVRFDDRDWETIRKIMDAWQG